MKSARGARKPLGGRRLRVAVVASRFNENVTDGLLRGAKAALARHGVRNGRCEVVRVPGAFELISAARWALDSGRYDAVVCLGAIVRGETPHFDYLARAVSCGLGTLAANTRVPLAFGVLTTETLRQARARSNGGSGNKGFEAAEAAVEMAILAQRWNGGRKRRAGTPR